MNLLLNSMGARELAEWSLHFLDPDESPLAPSDDGAAFAAAMNRLVGR